MQLGMNLFTAGIGLGLWSLAGVAFCALWARWNRTLPDDVYESDGDHTAVAPSLPPQSARETATRFDRDQI